MGHTHTWFIQIIRFLNISKLFWFWLMKSGIGKYCIPILSGGVPLLVLSRYWSLVSTFHFFNFFLFE